MAVKLSWGFFFLRFVFCLFVGFFCLFCFLPFYVSFLDLISSHFIHVVKARLTQSIMDLDFSSVFILGLAF